jgi:hypothetical protein
MKLVQFLRDMAARAMHLSRNTLDLATSRELRKMSEELKAKSEEREDKLKRDPDAP